MYVLMYIFYKLLTLSASEHGVHTCAVLEHGTKPLLDLYASTDA